MQRRVLMLAAVACLFGLTFAPQAQTPAVKTTPEYGPPNGTLVIVGGGSTEGTGIMEKFIELAGGPEAKFVIVPTAGGNMREGKPRVYEETQVIGVVAQARPQARDDAAHARPEGGRHGSLRDDRPH